MLNFVVVNDRDEEKVLCSVCLQEQDFESCSDEDKLFVVGACLALPCDQCAQDLEFSEYNPRDEEF